QPVRFQTCKLIAINYTQQAETANISYLSYHLLASTVGFDSEIYAGPDRMSSRLFRISAALARFPPGKLL
ncbi:hypothetical protein KH017_18750, partial [bacterium]|nr:hypothetical protein [bacterium]